MVSISLIPSVLALSHFFINNFPNISWYPYWYLGNPFWYLIGPIIPTTLLAFTRVLNLPLNLSYFSLIFLSQLIGAVGVYQLVK